jgi:hypothetical protein
MSIPIPPRKIVGVYHITKTVLVGEERDCNRALQESLEIRCEEAERVALDE